MKNTVLSKMNSRESAVKNVLFIIITIFLIFLSAFFVTGTVKSQAVGNNLMDEKYFQMLEKEYVGEIRSYLNEQGFENSGVTLTRVVDAQGNRDYCITLHHKYLEKLAAEDMEALFEAVESMAFREDGCIFQANLLR